MIARDAPLISLGLALLLLLVSPPGSALAVFAQIWVAVSFVWALARGRD